MNLLKPIIIVVVILLYTCFASAQNTMYYMDRMPQKQLFNPALMPNVKFFMALPGLNGVSAHAYNSGFNYNELDYFLDNIDNDNYNPDDFVNSIGNTNKFLAEARASLLSFGFKIKDHSYFSFNYLVNSTSSIDAESEIAYLLVDYNDLSLEKFPLVVDGVDIKSNSYTSMGFTYSRKINEHLTIGISPYLNFNGLGIRTNGLRYIVSVEDDSNGHSTFNETFEGEALVGLPTEINPDAIDGNELDLDEGLLPDGWENDIKTGDLFQNASFSVNLGATYEFQKWLFSASLLNLGSSKWKQNGYRLKGNQDVINVYEETVKMGIPTRLYLGANRQFSPKWNYGIVLNSNFYAGGANSSATVSLNGVVGRALSTSVSYTAGYKYDNLGLGFRLRIFPGMDLYAVTDNIIQAINYKKAYRLTASVGLNFSFGVKDGLSSAKETFEESNGDLEIIE